LTGDHRIEAHARDAMQAKQNRGTRGMAGMYQSMTKRFDGKEDKKVGISHPVLVVIDLLSNGDPMKTTQS